MPPKRSHHVCANCASFQHEAGGWFSQCRRNPPTLVIIHHAGEETTTETRFPVVQPDSWCGRWEPIIVVDAEGQPMEQGDAA